MRFPMLSLMILLLLGVLPLRAQEAQAPTVGSTAPDFSLPYATKDSISGKDLTLSQFYGTRNIILAFYPADWSGGCTKEVCTLRDNFTALSGLNAQVIGISGDYVFTHHEWAIHHNLPFILASDHRHTVAKEYSSYNDENGYNKRTVYVIDKKGTIAYRDLQYSVADLASFQKLQEALKKLQ